MAEVFAAKLYGADGFEKDLVIKQILPQHAKDPEFVQSFVAEAKIAVSLNHANIVAIYELGTVDGTYFIAMELVDGMDLYAFVDGCRRHQLAIEPGHALYAVEEVAKGLDYAHRGLGPDGQPLGLVHRDLNPRNVLVSKQGEIKILDFGIAKVRSTIAAMPKTRAGVVKGTTGYMSPEQAMGLEVDARTDIYQAGLLLYELLTGQALFWRPDDESTRALMRRHEVRPVSSVMSGLPNELDQLLFAALAKNPDDRIPDAASLVRYIAQLRFKLYPHASATGLGLQVARLAALDAQAEATVEPEIPATEDFSEVISRHIEQSIEAANVQTIARSDLAPRRPTTGSQPISLGGEGPTQIRIGPDEVPTDVAPPAAVRLGPVGKSRGSGRILLTNDGRLLTDEQTPPPAELSPFDVAIPPKAPNRRLIWGIVAGAVVVLLGLIGWLVLAAPATEPAPRPNREASLDAGVEPRSEVVPTQDEPVTPSRRRERRPAPPPSRPEPDPAASQGFATVAFGAKPCSSRVSIDGKEIARGTPAFDKKVPAGVHTVVVEGITCPQVDSPGSLDKRTPTVRQEVTFEPGTKMELMTSFEDGLIEVRAR